MDDDTYRLALVKIAGVTTSNDLTQDGFEAVGLLHDLAASNLPSRPAHPMATDPASPRPPRSD